MWLSKYYRQFLRFPLNLWNRARLKNEQFSIISMTCVGGIISHELKQRFNSPTIDLFMYPSDYIKFLNNLNYYLFCDMIETVSEFDFPVGLLGGDIRVYFKHATSFAKAKSDWLRRAKRINFDNLYIIMTQSYDCTDEQISVFDKLSYENKIVFTSRLRNDVKCAYYNPLFVSLRNGEVKDLCQYRHKFTGKRLIDAFNYVQFLNKGNYS